jgi:hypothetical protein
MMNHLQKVAIIDGWLAGMRGGEVADMLGLVNMQEMAILSAIYNQLDRALEHDCKAVMQFNPLDRRVI